jgi:hypothetical protein
MKKLYLSIYLILFSTSTFSQSINQNITTGNTVSIGTLESNSINSSDKSNDSTFKYEVGTRYWYGLNNTKFDYFNTGQISGNTLGNPAATLDWKNAASNNLEIFGKVTNDTNGWFVKGIIGIGVSGGKNGSLQDVDYLVNQVSYSDSISSADNNRNFYVGADIGKNFKFEDVTLSPIIGYYFWQASLQSYGGTLNPVGNNFCYASNCFGIPGGMNAGQSLSNSIIPISYTTRVQSPKIGGAVEYAINKKFKINFELDLYPFADIALYDYHNLGSYKVVDGNPNGVSRGLGMGYGGEFFMNYSIQNNLDLGVGVRYSKFLLKNQDMRFNVQGRGWVNNPNGLQQLDIQQMGVVASLTYRF